jgi:tRNA (adenine57-N1/adenine58-N1)-methyltransferase
MTPTDAGLVLGYAGIGTGDRVLDAGTGTGVLAAYLGLAGADVVTFERDAAFAEVAGENLRTAGLADRVDVVAADACDALAGHEADFDAVTLDTPDAPSLVERAPALLAPGGVAAAYSPFVEDARETAAAARDAGLDAETHETIERRMDFDDRGSRPTPAGVGHTGYLLIGRVTG